MDDSKSNRKPTHGAYLIEDVEGGNGFWTRIGSAWPHKDGHGFNIQIKAVPLDGKIAIRILSRNTGNRGAKGSENAGAQ